MNPYLRKQVLVPLLTVACVLALGAIAGLHVYDKYQSVQSRLGDFVEPRYARLAGLKTGTEALAAASTRARELEALYTYASDVDANQIGNDVQQRVRGLLTAAGMTISSSQVLPSKEETGLERIPLSVRAEGDMVALQGALVGIAEQRPAVLIDAVNVQAQGVPERGVQRLSVQFNFLVLRRLAS
ncbi:MAG: general secretion pathway protein GspM [Proteobacteria bacterium]|nr:general secretion pathway protein GspM [Pseudomonadota bacterium]